MLQKNVCVMWYNENTWPGDAELVLTSPQQWALSSAHSPHCKKSRLQHEVSYPMWLAHNFSLLSLHEFPKTILIKKKKILSFLAHSSCTLFLKFLLSFYSNFSNPLSLLGIKEKNLLRNVFSLQGDADFKRKISHFKRRKKKFNHQVQ